MKDEQLWFAKIADDVGTPTYVYDGAVVRRQFESLRAALPAQRSHICFAVKANSNLAILALLHELGSGFDTVSEGELRRVAEVAPSLSRTLFSGVGKTEDELEYAIAHDVMAICIECPEEVALIGTIASRLSVTARVAIRINPDVFVDTHPYLATGLSENKFGIAERDLRAVLDEIQCRPAIELVGVTCHIGSGISDCEAYRKALKKLLHWADSCRNEGHPVRFVDLGGGLAVSFGGHAPPLDISGFGRMVREELEETPYELIVEPGKYLVAECGTLVTKILYVKENGGRRFAIVDAGMNDLIRPSLYDAYHPISVVSPREGAVAPVDVVGPVCESGCYFARNRNLPPLARGDLLLIRDAGAYGFSMASNYNSRRRPAEILMTESGYHVVRRREEYADGWRLECAVGQPKP